MAYRTGFTLSNMPPRKSTAYLSWLHELPCIVCRDFRRPVHAHHVRRLGERADDLRAVPLCVEHHLWDSPVGVHRLGRRGFEVRFGIDLERTIRKLNAAWEPADRAKSAMSLTLYHRQGQNDSQVGFKLLRALEIHSSAGA